MLRHKSTDFSKAATVSKPFKIAYMMSRFPKITETFILYEMLAVIKQGVQVEIYPLMREHTNIMHPEAVPLVNAAHFVPHLSLSILGINLRALLTQPGIYIKTLWTCLWAMWGSRRYFFGILAFFPKSVYLAHLMQEAAITHLHAHFASFPAASAYIIHQFTGIPYSFTAHGSDLLRDQHMLCEKTQQAEFVVAISQYNKSVILEHCGQDYADKVHVVHCGVDTEVFKSTEGKATEKKPLAIVCTGTLHAVKGQTYLIQGCVELKKRGINFECQIVGDGPDQNALKAQVAEAGLDNLFVFRGSIPRQDVIETLRHADIFVLPSVPSSDGRREGIPVAVMEAMASGVPVVASELTGIPELVDNGVNGILVMPRDVTGIADSLEHLANDPGLRAQMGQAGRQKIREQFDLEKNAAVLATLFGFKADWS
jgi:colanic acid/amylovoran biosynthesis glycosyltransferase